MPLLSAAQIAEVGFAEVGQDVAISDRCSIYGASAISIASHVRIDDYVIITAREPVRIGSYVHISAFAFLGGMFGISIGDFASLSIRTTLLSGNDDFSGESLVGPLVPKDLRGVTGAPISIERLALLGAGSVVLPSVTLGEGAAVGALSLVRESLPAWGLYAGIPARLIRPRSRQLEGLAIETVEREEPT